MPTMTVQEKAIALLKTRTKGRGRPKKWENFSRQEKAIAVAYDVIQSVLSGVYLPTICTYVSSRPFRRAADRNVSVQRVLLEDKVKDCEACAIGSMFLSLIKFENRLTILELSQIGFGDEYSAGTQRLHEVFTLEQLDMIESAFECSSFGDRSDISYEDLIPAIHFGNQYYDPTDRVLAICMNIIENNGAFMP